MNYDVGSAHPQGEGHWRTPRNLAILRTVVSIVIPAHNEERVLARLLSALDDGALSDAEVVVVANGCTDRTADVARTFSVKVVETPVPSKVRALALGDAQVSSFPRLYVDGDVVLSGVAARALCDALRGGIHAAGPSRDVPMSGTSAAVRWYYDIWERLEGTRDELYGRGVLAVDEVGHQRLIPWRETMSDDLMIAMSFGTDERRVVTEASVLIVPPRNYRFLLRRRVRAMTGNQLIRHDVVRPLRQPPSAGPSLIRLAGREPRLIPRVVFFLATAVLAKTRGAAAARQPSRIWLRDDSSRF